MLDDSEELLTLKELRRILKASATTIKRWRSQGLLPEPRFWVGRTPRWKRGDIEAWIRLGGTRREEHSDAGQDQNGPKRSKRGHAANDA